MEWGSLLLILGGLGLCFLLYQSVKRNPERFSSQQLQKSFFTLGVLSILLILLIALLVFLLKS